MHAQNILAGAIVLMLATPVAAQSTGPAPQGTQYSGYNRGL
jgi:hypothetical protein